jgi:hypothetical protein
MPPAPRDDEIVYGPRRAPGDSVIVRGVDLGDSTRLVQIQAAFLRAERVRCTAAAMSRG